MDQQLTAILVDDEPNSLRVLELEIERHCPEIAILSTFQDPRKGLEAVKNTNPDVLFLDVEMPYLNGFDFVELLKPKPSMEIIFVTAHDHYAIEALRIKAVDYLLKPVSKVDLQNAVRRLLEMKSTNVKALKDDNNIEPSKDSKISLPSFDGYHILESNEIIFCKAANNYSSIYFKSGNTLLVTVSLQILEELLPKGIFYRCHRSYIINLKKVKKFVASNNGFLKLEDNYEVPYSRLKKLELKKILEVL